MRESSSIRITVRIQETTKVIIFFAALAYGDYFYVEGMMECDIRSRIRVNNNALAYFVAWLR